jgi:hypothetical protein
MNASNVDIKIMIQKFMLPMEIFCDKRSRSFYYFIKRKELLHEIASLLVGYLKNL